MKLLLAIAKALFGKLSLCALAGGIAGAVSGGMFGIVLEGYPAHTLPLLSQLQAGLILGAVAWIVLLIVIGVWLHYGLGQIAAQAFVNAIITSVLTVLLAYAIHIAWLATIIGMLVGILVGTILCLFCRRWDRGRKVTNTDVAGRNVTHG
jgi:hypothetical protein